MDLLERYLAAVGRDLPKGQRADVVAELRDDLLSMIEAEEERLGRPQTRAELEDMLVAFGHPLRVAGRYRKTQHLVGPDIFPFWWAWLRAALVIVATVYFVLRGVQALSSGDVSRILRGVDASLVSLLVFTFGAVTLAAAGIERWGKPGLLSRWRPSELPPAQQKPSSQFERVLELSFSLVFLGWWSGALHFRAWMPQPVRLDMAAVWTVWFWPILAYSVFECAGRAVALFKPGWRQTVLILRIARCLAAAGILSGVMQAGHFIDAPTLPATAQAWIDRGMAIGFSFAILGCLVSAATDVWQLCRMRRELPAAVAI